ncbi:hypothetical protein P171DRAFT_427807 [Karstenula rhodostoma CBS 690.94]|uniref:Peptidase A1 domain-containing protein n=1 Tax=Karstenula rhodostoma CBS 690.94 TaxID=1392251 RepID=A0A9P4UF51_9PLEO|nr:hypothetical protein P171DRAFT_427807 [Karstenula rhodostoma CBS 690.94]
MAFSSGWLQYFRVAPLGLIAIWAFTVAHVGAQQPPKNAGPDPVENFCMRWWSQSVVKNNTLYIDSGVQRFNDSGDVYLGINNYLLTIDMTKTWDWQIPSNKSGGLSIDVKRKNVTSPSTGTAVPNLIRGHLFHGPRNKSDTIYNFGGTTYMNNQSFEGYRQPDSSQYPLWTYDHTLDSPWDKHTIQQVWQPNHGAAAEDIERGVGFYLGGQIDMGTSTLTLSNPFKDPTQNLYMPLDGMLIINLVDLDVRAANISTSSMKRSSPRVGGTLEYIDAVGDSGILVALGGQIQPGLKFGEIANRTQGELIDFNTVDVFDLDSYFRDPSSSNGTWYEQTTTGDIPAPRIDFCTVYVSAPDNSSHHIYLYSGFDPINNKAYDDVAVLSIPSFTWTTLFDNGGAPRMGHNCHRVGKRQMVTVGGNVTTLRFDWELKGVAFLELSTAKWGSVFYSNITDTDYDVPTQLLNVTGGKANGGATVSDPKQGWTEKGLGDVFRKSRYTMPSSWPTSNNTSGSGDSQDSKKTNVGAIAGGVVGGVAGLAIIAGILFFLHRRRVKARAASELHGDEIPRSSSDEKKEKYELQGVNENDPAELAGPEAQELNAPREFVEADHDTAAWASELPGTNTVAGGVHGVPIVRTPGDDLPESPEYTPGLRRPSSAGGERRRSSSTGSNKVRGVQPAPVKQPLDQKKDYFAKPTTDPSSRVESPGSEDVFRTPHEQVSPPEPVLASRKDASLLRRQISPPEPVTPSTKPTESPTPPGTAL